MRLPSTSEALPYIGWNDVEVNKNDVLSQDALFEELNAEVTDVCVEAMIVESNAPTYQPQTVRLVKGAFAGR